jgi:hypothetical protein
VYPLLLENSKEFAPFLFLKFLLYYQKIKLIFKGMIWLVIKTVDTKKCDYCSGKGYFQLLLGGSETCEGCGGTGKKKE